MTKTQLLSKTEEYSLVQSAQRGDRKARTTLMRRNEGLVHKLVQKFPLKNAQVTYDDLYQQGCLGFLHAVDLFELDRGLRLSTYAYRWIGAYIRRYYQNQGRVVRLPAHLADRKYQLDRDVQRLTQEMGRTPSSEELDELVPGYTDLKDRFSHIVSLNSALDSGEDLMDIQPAVPTSDAGLEVDVLLDQLKEQVSERDFNILIHRYGLYGVKERSLAEIGEYHNLTRARCHQVVGNCVRVLQGLAS